MGSSWVNVRRLAMVVGVLRQINVSFVFPMRALIPMAIVTVTRNGCMLTAHSTQANVIPYVRGVEDHMIPIESSVSSMLL